MTASQPARRKPGRPSLLADLGPAPTRPAVMPLDVPTRTLAGLMDAEADARELALRAEARLIARLREQAEVLRTVANSVRVRDPDNPRWATVAQAAQYLGVTIPVVRGWLRQAGAAVRVNTRLRGIRISLADMDAWVAAEAD